MALKRFAPDEGPFVPLGDPTPRSIIVAVRRKTGRFTSEDHAVRLDGEQLATRGSFTGRPGSDRYSLELQIGMEASDDTHLLRDSRAEHAPEWVGENVSLSRDVLGEVDRSGVALKHLVTQQSMTVRGGRRFVQATREGTHALIALDEGFRVVGFDGTIFTHCSGDPIAIAPDAEAVVLRDGETTLLIDVPEGRVRPVAETAWSQLEFHDLGALFGISSEGFFSIWDDVAARWHALSPASVPVHLHPERWLATFTHPDGRVLVWAGGDRIIDLGDGLARGFIPPAAVRRLETEQAPWRPARHDHRGAYRSRRSSSPLTVRECLHTYVPLEDWSLSRRSPTDDDPKRIEAAFRKLKSGSDRLARQLEALDGGEWEVREGHLLELRAEMATACEALTHASDAAIEAHLATPAWALLAGRLLLARRGPTDRFDALTDPQPYLQVAALSALSVSDVTPDRAATLIEDAFDALSGWRSRRTLIAPHRALTTLRRHVGFVRPRLSEMMRAASDVDEREQLREVLSRLEPR